MDQERQKRVRKSRKRKLQEISKISTEAAKILNLREECGRPRIEVDQPELLKTITEIASRGCGADPRRQTNISRSCQTLGKLKIELEKNFLSESILKINTSS